jgi:hypothetical protein
MPARPARPNPYHATPSGLGPVQRCIERARTRTAPHRAGSDPYSAPSSGLGPVQRPIERAGEDAASLGLAAAVARLGW